MLQNAYLLCFLEVLGSLCWFLYMSAGKVTLESHSGFCKEIDLLVAKRKLFSFCLFIVKTPLPNIEYL